jgi:RNA polymerase sigma factor (sigma-70 family)
MDADTRIGGGDGRFPETRHSALDRARDADPAARSLAFDAIVTAYWKPVYKYIRARWRHDNEGAKDLTQSFFAKALAGGLFAGYEPHKAAFRTFLRLCVDRFVSNERQYVARQKRSGATEPLEDVHEAAGCDPEELFHREWMRQVFAASVAELRAQVRPEVWRAFELYDLAETGRPSYRDIASELDVEVTQVTNYLAAARRVLRRIVLSRIRSVTGTEAEYREEVRAVLGSGA